MKNNWSWKNRKAEELKKVVFALNMRTLDIQIEDHSVRGWVAASEIKPYGNGYGILMRFPKKRGA